MTYNMVIIKNKLRRNHILKRFRMIICEQYLAILHTRCKMVTTENKGRRVDFIKYMGYYS